MNNKISTVRLFFIMLSIGLYCRFYPFLSSYHFFTSLKPPIAEAQCIDFNNPTVTQYGPFNGVTQLPQNLGFHQYCVLAQFQANDFNNGDACSIQVFPGSSGIRWELHGVWPNGGSPRSCSAVCLDVGTTPAIWAN